VLIITMAEEKKESAEARFGYDGIPEEKAWLFSQLFYTWQRPLFRRANQLNKQGKALEQDDLLPLPTIDHGDVIGPIFEEAWTKRASYSELTVKRLEDLKTEANYSTKRLSGTLLEVMGARFWIAGAIKMLNSLLQFCFPILLKHILKFIEETQAGIIDANSSWGVRYRGYWLSALLLIAMGSKAVTENAYFHRVVRCGFQARASVTVAVYNKSLRLTNAERQSTTLGEFSNVPFSFFCSC
jgi:hypothetical protein